VESRVNSEFHFVSYLGLEFVSFTAASDNGVCRIILSAVDLHVADSGLTGTPSTQHKIGRDSFTGCLVDSTKDNQSVALLITPIDLPP
jgi:hypothetical protein